MATYTILNSMSNDIIKNIKRIVKKCEKNSIPYKFTISSPYNKLVKVNDHSFEVCLVDLDLDVKFKLNGWNALGIVQRKDGIIQCYFDDSNLIKQYKDTDFHCDHCHKKVHRNSVVILENDKHERKVIGTSCVKEFTSGLDGNLIAEVNNYMHILNLKNSELRCLMQGEDNADVFFESHGTRTYNVVAVISAAKRLIDKYGFESSNSYNATWKFIMDEYDRTKIEDEAVNAIEWIKSLSEDEINKSSYLFNIKQIIDAGYCTGRHFGFLASLIPSYRKSEYKRLLDNNKKESEYIGNVGDKLTIKVKYLNSYSYSANFGTSYIYIFEDDNGNIIKWSTGTPLIYTIEYNVLLNNPNMNYTYQHALDKGAIIKLSGKIKAHDEYRNQKQTVLTRCKYEVLGSNEMNEKLDEVKEYYSKDHKPVWDEDLNNIMDSWCK